MYEHFYWWSSTTLVSSANHLCLTLENVPPKHGDRIALKPCQRLQTIFSQSWIVIGDYITSGWRSDVLNMKRPLMKIVYNRLNRQVDVFSNCYISFSYISVVPCILRLLA